MEIAEDITLRFRANFYTDCVLFRTSPLCIYVNLILSTNTMLRTYVVVSLHLIGSRDRPAYTRSLFTMKDVVNPHSFCIIISPARALIIIDLLMCAFTRHRISIIGMYINLRHLGK